MSRLGTVMVDSGFCTPADIEGCTPDEIAQIVAPAEFPLPTEYLAFLQVFGRKPGTLFQGREIHFPACLLAPTVAEEISEDPEESLTTEDRFFFGHHQGYIVFFFQRGMREVFAYQEGHPNVQTLGENFTSWLWHVLERTRDIRADGERLERETERKRAQMRAEGKL
ncbi:SMI1/KNR4 family protein [Nocardia sp. NEAU-G5]|uniref:SMI1/KNR4 family protein n=1 Tax=Nocardia albiluteola TaxID=2842303 RepID=A0ABS6B7W2_9NOCA|nr:SMI1/KNR4 family protein [Nocardia albiluteola]MBU3066402.1 SMI1/KNR4 family protein [Nocardia albiluteola]